MSRTGARSGSVRRTMTKKYFCPEVDFACCLVGGVVESGLGALSKGNIWDSGDGRPRWVHPGNAEAALLHSKHPSKQEEI